MLGGGAHRLSEPRDPEQVIIGSTQFHGAAKIPADHAEPVDRETGKPNAQQYENTETEIQCLADRYLEPQPTGHLVRALTCHGLP